MKAGTLAVVAKACGIDSRTKSQIFSDFHALKPVNLNTWRILSIDPGICNLGFCYLNCVFDKTTYLPRIVSVQDWRHVDLTNESFVPSGITLPIKYSRKTYAQAALDMSSYFLKEYQPTHILIEQQRHRTNGAIGVAEWVLKVNFLEAMFWASFQAMKQNSTEIVSVLPGQMASFIERFDSRALRIFTTQAFELEDQKSSSQSIKKLRQNYLQALLRESDIIKIREGLPVIKKNKTKKDDLADCLLQALIWIEWQRNIFLLQNQKFCAGNEMPAQDLAKSYSEAVD